MKTIVLFQSDAFDQSWPADGSDPNEPPLGRDVAEFLRQKMLTLGVVADVAVEATGGWEFDVTLKEHACYFYVHWAPIGDPPEDYWVIQTRRKQGVLKTLFGKSQPPAADIQPALDLLKKVIEESAEITGVRWLDTAEFQEAY